MARRWSGYYVGCAALLVLGMFVPQVLLMVKSSFFGRSRDPQTLAGLKFLSLGVQNYCQEFVGQYPPDMSSVRAAYRYIDPGANVTLLSPGIGEPREYLGNGSLSSRSESEVKNPNWTLLFFDSAPISGRDGTKNRIVSMVDTSSRVISEKQFQDAVANHFVRTRLEP